ncbi:hypothetical protein NDA11_002051 [Ustilago hordei]|nr:hypothetical protein NDA11_002051 [Ustilago hordei]
MLLAGPSANFLVKQLNETRKRNGKAVRPELAYLELVADVHSAGANISKRAQSINTGQIGGPAALLDLLGFRAALLVDRLTTAPTPRTPTVYTSTSTPTLLFALLPLMALTSLDSHSTKSFSN